MSTSVFPGCDGSVTRLDTRGYCQDDMQLFSIYFGSGLSGGTRLRFPVTGFALEVGGNYQFLHTVNDFIYFYSFGDRVGELNVTGMAFIRKSCDAGIGFSTNFPSYLNPFNYNVNPFNSDFYNDPNWVSTKEWRIKLGQVPDSICDLWNFYQTNRAAAKNSAAVKVQWGRCEAFWGFLTGMRVEIARPDVPVAQFVLRIHIVKP